MSDVSLNARGQPTQPTLPMLPIWYLSGIPLVIQNILVFTISKFEEWIERRTFFFIGLDHETFYVLGPDFAGPHRT